MEKQTRREQILQAAYESKLDDVRRLLREEPALANSKGIPDQWEGATPLTLAAFAGHIEIVGMLLELGADVNPVSNDGSALAMASWSGHADVAALLIARGANPNVATAS